MARMGHALTILVQDWEAVLDIGEAPGGCTVAMSARLASLKVLEGHGGATPLNDEGLRKIQRNTARLLEPETYPEMTFTSTSVTGAWDRGRVEGELTIHGTTREQGFDVHREANGRFWLTGTIRQSRFGIKPYSAMMGALRLGDDVSVKVAVTL